MIQAPKVLSFETPFPVTEREQEIAQKYWDQQLGDYGDAYYTITTKDLCKEYGITQKTLVSIVAATATARCVNCESDEYHTKISGLSRTSYADLLRNLNGRWVRSELLCPPCLAKKEAEREAQRLQYEAERAQQEVARAAQQTKRRELKYPKLQRQYGRRLAHECACGSGYMVLKLNSKTLQLFYGCTSHPNCTEVATVPDHYRQEAQRIFLDELHSDWDVEPEPVSVCIPCEMEPL